MRSVLVTGATGPLGRRLVELLDNSHRVTAWGSADIDLRDAAAVSSAVTATDPELVFHLAGIRHGAPEDFLATNVDGLRHLAEALVRLGTGARLVVAGSSAQYGLRSSPEPIGETAEQQPTTPYGSSKAAQETLALTYTGTLRVNVARLFNLIGAGQRPGLLAEDLAAQLRDDHCREAVTGDLSGTRDFVDFGDAARALLIVASAGGDGEAYNVCSGRNVALRALAARLVELSGRDVPLVERRAERAETLLHQVGDPGKLEALGWRAETPLDESLRALLR